MPSNLVLNLLRKAFNESPQKKWTVEELIDETGYSSASVRDALREMVRTNQCTKHMQWPRTYSKYTGSAEVTPEPEPTAKELNEREKQDAAFQRTLENPPKGPLGDILVKYKGMDIESKESLLIFLESFARHIKHEFDNLPFIDPTEVVVLADRKRSGKRA